jgi:cytochrome P450
LATFLKTAGAKPQPSVDFNPFIAPDLEDPHPKLREARARWPVFFSPALGTWVLTRYGDVLAALADPGRFSSAASITNDRAPLPGPVLKALSCGIAYQGGMVDMDPPEHTMYRSLFNRAFTPRRIAAIEPRVAAAASRLMASLRPKGSGDLVRDFAFPLPMRVIASLFGIPESDMDDFTRWSEQWVVLTARRGTTAELVSAAEEVVAFQRYIHGLLEDRRAAPGDDLLGNLFRAMADLDEPPTTDALVGVIMTILFAGHETTTALIGNAVRHLIAHPEQLAEARSDSSVLPGTITEVLRFDPPVSSMYRTATTAVEVGGVSLPAGSHIQLSFVSANRDEQVFADPDRFDIHRAKDQPILSFGRGAHFCIGAALGQMEARVALEQVLTLPGLRLIPGRPVRPIQSATVRSSDAIWLEWDR